MLQTSAVHASRAACIAACERISGSSGRIAECSAKTLETQYVMRDADQNKAQYKA